MPSVGGINVGLGRAVASFAAGLDSLSAANEILLKAAGAKVFSVTGRHDWAMTLFSEVGDVYLGGVSRLKQEFATPTAVANIERGAAFYFMMAAREARLSGDFRESAAYYGMAISAMEEVVFIGDRWDDSATLADIYRAKRAMLPAGTNGEAAREAGAREKAWLGASGVDNQRAAAAQQNKLQEIHAKLAVQYLLEARKAMQDGNLPVARSYLEKAAAIYGSMADYASNHKDPQKAVVLFMAQAEGLRRAREMLPDHPLRQGQLRLLEEAAVAYEKAADVAEEGDWRRPWLQYKAGLIKVNSAVVANEILTSEASTDGENFALRDGIDKAVNQAMNFFRFAARHEKFSLYQRVLQARSYELQRALDDFHRTHSLNVSSSKGFLNLQLEDAIFETYVGTVLGERGGRHLPMAEQLQDGLRGLSDADRAQLTEILRDVELKRSGINSIVDFLGQKMPGVDRAHLAAYLERARPVQVFQGFRGEVNLETVFEAGAKEHGKGAKPVVEESFFRRAARRAGR